MIKIMRGTKEQMRKSFCRNLSPLLSTIFFVSLFLVLFSSPSYAYPTPVNWWTYDVNDTIGTTAIDVVLGNNVSIINGVATSQPGLLKESYLYDGVDDYLLVNDYYNYTSTGEMSVTAWVKTGTLPGDDGDIIGHYSSTGDNRGWILQVRNNVARFVTCSAGTLASCSYSTGTVNIGSNSSWVFLTGVWNSTHMMLYVNETQEADIEPVTTIFSSTFINTRVGRSMSSTWFTGNIDQIQIFNVSLNATAISELYNNGSGVFFTQENITVPFNSTPSAVNLLTPLNGSSLSGVVNFSWTTSSDLENDTITYSLYIDGIIRNITQETSVLFNVNSIPDGNLFWYVQSSDGVNTNQSDSFNFLTDTIAPVFTLLYPNNLLNWGNGSIEGTCSDDNLLNISVNGTNIDEISIIDPGPANWLLIYNDTNTTPHNESYSITCLDTFNNSFTDTRVYNFNLVSPFCLFLSAQELVNEGSAVSWNLTCEDDTNYFSLNVTCTGGSSFSFYQDNINLTEYNFVGNTELLFENSQCTFISSDSHTKNDIRKTLNRYSVKRDNNKINLPRKKNIIEYVGVSRLIDLSFDFGDKDRVKFSYSWESNPSKKVRDYTFFVNSNNRISYIDNNLYPGWFVIDNYYWVDFDLSDKKGIDYKVEYVNETTFAVTVSTSRTNLDFHSTGIINTFTQVQNIIVVPSEQISSLSVGVCPVSVNGALVLWLVVSIAFALLLLMLYTKVGIFGFFSGIVFLISSWTLSGCNGILGMVIAFFSLIILLLSALYYHPGGVKNDVFS